MNKIANLLLVPGALLLTQFGIGSLSANEVPALSNTNNNADTIYLYQQPNDGEYWWLVNNTRRWLYRHCAQKHIDAGETVGLIEYDVLKDIARDDGPCPAVTDKPETPNPKLPDPVPPGTEVRDPHHDPKTPVGKDKLETLRNNNPLFRQHESLSSLDLTGLGFYHDSFTQPSPVPDNGASPQGQFRIGCQYSHFAYDDPIVKPSQPGESHLHMFWGNTSTDAFTIFDELAQLGDANNIMESGGSTCQGFELNRSAYWMPALLTSKHSPRSIVVPDNIVIYYKSHRPKDVNPLPAGIQLLAGNVGPGGHMHKSFTANNQLFWSCGQSGSIRGKLSSIPTDCKAGEYINATISFPQCLAVDVNGKPVLSSPDFMSHARMVPSTAPCPASHPYRVPQISYLAYFPNGTDGAGAGVSNWVLSSDHGVPGGSLHGDWLGGWHELAIQKWIDGCYDPNGNFSGSRNCSIGQTGRNGSNRQFRRVSRLNDYDGPNFLSLD